MPKQFSKLPTDIVTNGEFLLCSADAKALFFMLYADQDVRLSGVQTFVPHRWHVYDRTWTADRVRELVDELVEHYFVLYDTVTQELWLRMYIRAHVPGDNRRQNSICAGECAKVRSLMLRDAIADEYPWLGIQKPSQADLDRDDEYRRSFEGAFDPE